MVGPAESPPSAVILLFARLPAPGQCKTRLAAAVGAAHAAAVYDALLERAVRAAAAACDGGGGGGGDPRLSWRLLAADGADAAALPGWLASRGLPQPSGGPPAAQPGGGGAAAACLGRRLHGALGGAFAAAPGLGAALAVGTDVPCLSPGMLRAAAAALLAHRAAAGAADGAHSAAAAPLSLAPSLVSRPHSLAFFTAAAAAAPPLLLGPSPDGGFYLIGVDRPPPGGALLPPPCGPGVRWSSPFARSDVERNAAAAGLRLLSPPSSSPPLLPALADVDTAGDLEEWRGTKGGAGGPGGRDQGRLGAAADAALAAGAARRAAAGRRAAAPAGWWLAAAAPAAAAAVALAFVSAAAHRSRSRGRAPPAGRPAARQV